MGTWRRSSLQAKKAAAADAVAAVGTKGAINKTDFDAYFFFEQYVICQYIGSTIKQTFIDVLEWNILLLHVQCTAHADNPPVYTCTHGRPLVFTPCLIRVFG